MQQKWNTPGGKASALCIDILNQTHTLIAGCTGSGKSVLINSLIYTALYRSPLQCRFILIDPKRVELIDYATIPHTLLYASEAPDITNALTYAVNTMERRYKRMQSARLKQSSDAHIYVIIDEYADLITTQKKKDVLQPLQRLAQLGRAANLHLIIATQRPTRDIIDGRIKVNIDSRIALRCASLQDSKNIINIKGAETLPRYGYGYYLTSNGCTLVEIPYTPPTDITARVQWWQAQTRHKFKFTARK